MPEAFAIKRGVGKHNGAALDLSVDLVPVNPLLVPILGRPPSEENLKSRDLPLGGDGQHTVAVEQDGA